MIQASDYSYCHTGVALRKNNYYQRVSNEITKVFMALPVLGVALLGNHITNATINVENASAQQHDAVGKLGFIYPDVAQTHPTEH